MSSVGERMHGSRSDPNLDTSNVSILLPAFCLKERDWIVGGDRFKWSDPASNSEGVVQPINGINVAVWLGSVRLLDNLFLVTVLQRQSGRVRSD